LDKQREQEAIKLKDELLKAEEKVKSDEEIRVYDAKKQIDEKYAKLQHERDMEKLGLQSSLNIIEKTSEVESAVPVS